MKKVIIYGLGVSGQAMYELLGDECEILLYRDGEGVPEWAEGKKFLGKGESIPDDTDALLLSPSVPLNRPLVKACKEKNIPVMGELELGYIRSKCRVVAVTGTNGKTTTVSLINHILRSAGRSSWRCRACSRNRDRFRRYPRPEPGSRASCPSPHPRA